MTEASLDATRNSLGCYTAGATAKGPPSLHLSDLQHDTIVEHVKLTEDSEINRSENQWC